MRMLPSKSQLLWIALLWSPGSSEDLGDELAAISAQQAAPAVMPDSDIPDNLCFVCGEGGQIQSTTRMVTTTFGMYTCSGLAGAGTHGNIPEGQCSAAQTFAMDKCGCILGDGASLNENDSNACNICPNEGLVTIPEGVVSMPGDAQNITCGQYLELAENGVLEADQCETLQGYTDETCGCIAVDEVEELTRPEASNETETFVCPVCGEGMTSSTPDATVTLPSGNVRSCSDFERIASLGRISETQCSIVKPFVEEACSCQSGSPVAPPPTMAPGAFDCPLCGRGNVISLPDGIVTIPTQPNRTCAELQHANSIGNIGQAQCGLLQPFVASPCGCMPMEDTAKPSAMPSDSPSMAPIAPQEPTMSPAPTGWSTQKPGCFDNLMEIYNIEKEVKDPSERRRYILCPSTTYSLGTLTNEGRINNGDAFLMLRPNVMYQCGEDGSRQNNCILKGGDFGVTSFYGVYEGIYETVDNVRILGLTFQSQTLFAAAMEAAGDIEFIDCAFKDHGNMAPILMQWRGDGPKVPVEEARERKLRSSAGPVAAQLFKKRVLSGQPTQEEVEAVTNKSSRKLQEVGEPEFRQVVTFRDCVFRGNHVTDKMGFPGVIENSFGSDLNIINCLFQDNKYGQSNNPAQFGYAIRSYGPLYVESSCFMDNTFQAHGPIQVFGAPHTTVDNYVRSSQEDLTCDFLAVFATKDDTTTAKPVCFNSDATACSFSQPPTMAPTRSPPTNAPVQSPVQKDDEPTKTPPASTSSGSSIRGHYFAGLVAACTMTLVGAFTSYY